jgi:hypothetical protein
MFKYGFNKQHKQDAFLQLSLQGYVNLISARMRSFNHHVHIFLYLNISLAHQWKKALYTLIKISISSLKVYAR